MSRKPPLGEGVPQPPLTWQDLPDEAFIGGKREDKGTTYRGDFFEKHPDKIVPGALNNFHALFKGGRARALYEDVLREMPEEADQDRAKFFSILDKAAQDVGIDLERIRALSEEMDRLWEEGKEEASQAVFQKLREEILPVYKKMRELGYTHNDLIT